MPPCANSVACANNFVSTPAPLAFAQLVKSAKLLNDGDVSSANPTLNRLPPEPSISLAIDLNPPVMELAIEPVKSFAIWVDTSVKIFLIVSPKSSNLPVKTLKSVSSIFFSKVSKAIFI